MWDLGSQMLNEYDYDEFIKFLSPHLFCLTCKHGFYGYFSIAASWTTDFHWQFYFYFNLGYLNKPPSDHQTVIRPSDHQTPSDTIRQLSIHGNFGAMYLVVKKLHQFPPTLSDGGLLKNNTHHHHHHQCTFYLESVNFLYTDLGLNVCSRVD